MLLRAGAQFMLSEDVLLSVNVIDSCFFNTLIYPFEVPLVAKNAHILEIHRGSDIYIVINGC